MVTQNARQLFKHPLVSNWQQTPLFSDEQIEVGELAGQFDTGYGILVNGLIVIDVDERNGGVYELRSTCRGYTPK